MGVLWRRRFSYGCWALWIQQRRPRFLREPLHSGYLEPSHTRVAKATSTWGIDMSAGEIYTVAGIGAVVGGGMGDPIGDDGPAADALLSRPYGVAIDKRYNLYISDTGITASAWCRRRQSHSGAYHDGRNIYTVAGSEAVDPDHPNDIGDGGRLPKPRSVVLVGSAAPMGWKWTLRTTSTSPTTAVAAS
jgi:hypothetical protein